MTETGNGFDLLGAELPKPPLSWKRSALALAAGIVGAAIYPKHWALMFLNSAALASNVHAVAAGERTWKNATKRMGRHVVATAGSLALPSNPAIGYIAGAVAADLLIDGEGGGIIEEWSEYEGIRDHHCPGGDVIDAEIVDSKPNALVKVKP